MYVIQGTVLLTPQISSIQYAKGPFSALHEAFEMHQKLVLFILAI